MRGVNLVFGTAMLLKISKALLWLSELFADAHEWLHSTNQWRAIRERRNDRPQ
jgi:hypothetical protein